MVNNYFLLIVPKSPPSIDDLSDNILKLILDNLTVKELVAVERVSKKWQKNVLLIHSCCSVLAIRTKFQNSMSKVTHNLCQIKSHFINCDDVIILRNFDYRIVSLLKKLPNLTTFYLDISYVTIFDEEVFDENLKKIRDALQVLTLEHLEVYGARRALFSISSQSLNCFTFGSFLELVETKCPSIKNICGLPSSPDRLITLLKNGLININGHFHYKPGFRDAILRHGSNLEVLNMKLVREPFENWQFRIIRKTFIKLREFGNANLGSILKKN